MRKEPIYSIGERVEYNGKPYLIVGFDGIEGAVIAVWLRVDGGNHYVTATTRELKRR